MSTAQNNITDFDVVVIGGGIAGLVFTALLADLSATRTPALRIALLESLPPGPMAADAELDLRVLALAPASRAILLRLGLWQLLPAARVSPYSRMCVWQAAGQAGDSRSISFDAAELGEAELGYIVENRALRQVAWQHIKNLKGVSCFTDAAPTKLIQDTDNSTITFTGGQAITAKLVVAADGARSWSRQQLGVEYHERGYGQVGIVSHIITEQPHQATAWQRFLPEGPVALLPLADGRSSLVWSCPDEQAKELLAADAQTFARQLETALDGALGRIECTTPRVSFPLAKGYAKAYTGRRFALIGDAAHRVHPLAGQGANLGLLDAASLAEQLAIHLQLPLADPGDLRVLRRYERARKGDNLLTMGAMDLLNQAFMPPLGEWAGMGMEMVDRLRPLKSRLARYAMGQARDLPAVAQPLID
ncbi:MAG: UbiH/UbiF/VisC/COQ6 family ubiquinone biosynthesis hydroxylase [Gammaproteobacteria bacterium]|nr:UbiH/UbiF/VisC/COQ6 family ubiquinone biosynthesis hydroxylase [Gammaproteobacteria bacterium]MCP4089204.1 UbiH/UbiF/VisC/COQ6 family ubiquinone biosynthesis hydroxylase [Gammaproteobacteria bacterium]MCP4276772.1 UbiH/UbiF/VisC/COQ6 family ubiquinone biosynthesis hydroxylase [Gammaproteobacteria bacterium]MCP4830615.1 UbiH/UbiF/VisC/COQ6 family ubiquinone biosynthesis hydroxylase [Gammaproteobacteria bacterium]MCP4928424.1 UbiH/UbiF/VisC/COQ6 family ubiquinone biosynthesis hydroxylase [Gamm